MSVFGKALASLGVGSAKVDTRLEKAQYRQGDTIRGEIFVQGGQAVQQIDDIYLYLVVRYHQEGSQKDYVVNQFRLTESFEINPMETRVFPFQVELPMDMPVTTGASMVYLKTGLDIKMAKDPTDMDGIEILPHALVDGVLTAVEQAGFRLSGVDFAFDKFYSRHPFVQEYVMAPQGVFKELVDELYLVFYPQAHEVDVIMAVDRKAIDLMTSMEEALNLDERFVRFTVTRQELERNIRAVETRITDLIRQQLE
jgi:sporulation-control protein